jgi:TolA-binding protein
MKHSTTALIQLTDRMDRIDSRIHKLEELTSDHKNENQSAKELKNRVESIETWQKHESGHKEIVVTILKWLSGLLGAVILILMKEYFKW